MPRIRECSLFVFFYLPSESNVNRSSGCSLPGAWRRKVSSRVFSALSLAQLLWPFVPVFFSPIISIFIIFYLSPSYFLSLSLFLLGSLFLSLTLSLYVCLPLHLSSYFCLFCLFVFLSLAFYLCLSLFFPFLCVCLYLPPVLCISYSFKCSLLYYLLFSSTLS